MNPTDKDVCHSWDKIGLFILAALVVLVLLAVVVGTYWTQGVPDKGDVLLGGIATGLILFLRDLINAVRSSWEEQTRAATNEQLARSAPAVTVPDDAAAAADAVASAAAREADQITGSGGKNG